MRTAVFIALIALAGCKTDKNKPATGSGSAGSGSAGSGSSVAAGSAAGSNDVPKGATLKLPKGDGTPPKKTTQELLQADFERMAKLEFEGFEKADRTSGPMFEVRLTTPRPRLAVTVTATKCSPCVPMDLEKWKARDDLKALLAPQLRDLPDTVFELGKADLNGQPVIFTYQLGYQSGQDENGPVGAYSNAYALYFNDGMNQIRVVSEYKDDWVTREDMQRIAPREDLEKLARAFLDAYTHAWAP
ncbi:MAG: hypothetical protein ACKV2T_23060 [Kofleriaceae bacterium]